MFLHETADAQAWARRARRRSRTSTSSPAPTRRWRSSSAIHDPGPSPRDGDLATLTAAYTNLLLRPEPGPGRVRDLLEPHRRLPPLLRLCTHLEQWLAVVTPISYSVAHEQLHHVLAGYKRWPAPLGAPAPSARSRRSSGATCVGHEACQAAAAGVAAFELVTTVPGRDASNATGTSRCDGSSSETSSRRAAATGGCCAQRPTGRAAATSTPSASPPTAPLDGEVGAADRRHLDLRRERPERGGGAAVSRRRHGRRRSSSAATSTASWRENDRHLAALARPFDWDRCVHCAASGGQPAEAARRSDSFLTPRSSWLITGFIAAT